VAQLDLETNLEELRDTGYTVITVGRELTDRIRSAILQLTDAGAGSNASFDRVCATPLGADVAFTEACTHSAVTTVAEFMCGRGCILSSILGTVRTSGSAVGTHCDQGHLPDPFPEHIAYVTACWITDEFTKANGATMMLPGTHKFRRSPRPGEDPGVQAVPIECPAGSVVIWDGAVWHGNYPRSTPGERVVLHVTYGRLAYQSIHDFSYVPDCYWASVSPEMRGLLGANLGYRTNSRFVHIDDSRYGKMILDSRR
jgi:hypothetical protein